MKDVGMRQRRDWIVTRERSIHRIRLYKSLGQGSDESPKGGDDFDNFGGNLAPRLEFLLEYPFRQRESAETKPLVVSVPLPPLTSVRLLRDLIHTSNSISILFSPLLDLIAVCW